MKPLLLILFFIISIACFAQSPDYLVVKKSNGRIIKSFYTGSQILVQTTDGSYVQGPIKFLRNDTVYILLYDIRLYPTMLGNILRDTISVQTVSLHYKDIKRIQLTAKRNFVERTVGPLMMIGGAGYFALNILNGALYNGSITSKKNLRTLGISAGVFGLGYFFTKLFSSDGFTKKKHRIEYVDL